MEVDKALLDLLDGLYRSAVEPALWEQALDDLLDIFKSQHAFLYTTHTAEGTSPLLVTSGIDRTDRDRYLTSEADRGFAPISARIVDGVAVGIQDVVRLDEFHRSEFYNEIVRPTHCVYSGLVKETKPDVGFHLVFCRPAQRGAFESDETDLLQRLLPHVSTAMSIRQCLHVSEQRSFGFEALIDRLEQPTILVDALCKPMFINTRAHASLAAPGGLSLVKGVLQCAIAIQTTQLNQLVARLAEDDQASVQNLYLSQPAPKLPLLLDLIPLWRLGLSEVGTQPPRVAIVIRHPGDTFVADRAALQDILKLTPRESEIADLLANGASVDFIATQLVLTPGTVRYNLQKIFDKVGVHSQGALIALTRSFGQRAKNTALV